MRRHAISPDRFTIPALSGELAAREQLKQTGNHMIALNPIFHGFTTREIQLKYRLMIDRNRKQKRGNWHGDNRREINSVKEKKVIRNAHSVTLICKKNNLLDTGNGAWELKVKCYGETYYLYHSEPFYHQPVSAGLMCTGVLVAANVVATAAHFLNGSGGVRNLVFLFDFVMGANGKPTLRFPKEKVYQGLEVLYREYDVGTPGASGADIALLRLDRNVEGQEIAKLSKEPAVKGKKLYSLGHPCGLPMKYAPGGFVKHIEPTFIMTELDLYSCSSGSPVFSQDTHELQGTVSGGDPRDFELKDNRLRYTAVNFPNKEIESIGTRIIKLPELSKVLFNRKR